jgi:hypothetical protein
MTYFFQTSLWFVFLVPGSGMCKIQNPGSWLNVPDPQHCCLLSSADQYLFWLDPDPDPRIHAFESCMLIRIRILHPDLAILSLTFKIHG